MPESNSSAVPTQLTLTSEDFDDIERRYREKLQPKPKVIATDIQKIVLVWKITQGYDKNDASWDKINFSRCVRFAKSLLEFLGNWETAADCIEDIHKKFTDRGLDCTLNTVVGHAASWKIEKLGRQNGKLPPSRNGSLSVIK